MTAGRDGERADPFLLELLPFEFSGAGGVGIGFRHISTLSGGVFDIHK